MTSRLSVVEGFRAQVLLDEALKKLHFLTSISTSSSLHGDELIQFMGDEISRIIQEQRDLEKKYEELIAKRGQLKGLCNKGEYLAVQRQIQDVAHKLKDSNRQLCRNLKENPNVQGNLLKMQAERAQVQEWLEETKTDLAEMSFANLVAKVEAERREQERLSEVKKREREATQMVAALTADLQQMYTEHEKETKLANHDIKEHKEELQKNRTISAIELTFEEKKLRAQESALLRIHKHMEKKLQDQVQELQDKNSLEATVHDRAHEFLQEKLGTLAAAKDQWQSDYDKEVQNKQGELDELKDRRERGLQELNDLEERKRATMLEHKAKEDEMRNAVIIEKQRRDQLQRMADAVLLLQEEGRAYIDRIMERRKATKKGKKGKKGGKKK